MPVFIANFGILSLVVLWARAWARAPLRELRLNLLDALLGFLVFWSFFSTLFAPYFHPAQSASLSIVCYIALYGYLSFNPSFVGLSLALGVVRAQAVFQSLLVLGEAIFFARVRPAGTFYNPNFLAGFLAVALLLVVGRQIFPPTGLTRRPLSTVLATAEGALLLAALVTTGSRGGALALAIGLLFLLALRSWKVASVALTTTIVALLAIPNPLVRRLQTLPFADDFAFTRLDIWKGALSMMFDHPWVGIGLGQYNYVSTRYAFPIETHWAKYTRVAENAHSEYLQAGAELGVPGILIALGVVALLGWAILARLRALPRAAWGPIATLAAPCAAIAVQAAVDFPVHAPPTALLLVLLAAGLRLHGVTGPESAVSVRIRPVYAVAAGLVALMLALTAARPLVGFWYYLRGIGAPHNLLREKWSLEEAPRAEPHLEEAARLLGLAARIDSTNAPYHRALGGVYFQLFLRGAGGPGALQQALYQLHYAAELNPNQYQYPMNLGQMMVALARREPPGRERLGAALAHYRRAAELAPFQYSIQVEIGILADELGDTAAAEGAFRRAVAIEEYFLRGWLNLGTFYARHRRFSEAREALGRGAALAEQARTLVPTTKGEAGLLAIEPDVFYNELKKIQSEESFSGVSS